MEVDEIQTPQPARKFSRVNSNGGRIDSSKLATDPPTTTTRTTKTQPITTTTTTTLPAATGTATTTSTATENRLRQWPHSSRIIRVSRASGGKDRHSKVWTARGPRDRRVRLSVNTAIQFYDLQDRLGYEQPSKAVEWLIKAAADAINELPSLDSCATFPPETPRQLSDERRPDSDGDGEPGLGQTNQLSRSGCSSNNSENSKGSGLSLSRSEIRVKARERARERTAKEKERENEPTRVHVSGHHHNQQQQNVTTMPQTSSFTQLLTAGITNLNESNAPVRSSPGASSLSPDVGLFQKQARGGGSNNNQWLAAATSTTPMDYFGSTTGLIGNPSSLPQIMAISSFSVGGSASSENHQHHHNHHQHGLQHHHPQHFPLVAAAAGVAHDQQHLIPIPSTAGMAVGAGGGNVYNFNFTISSSSTSSGGLGAGFNRGTLQSNSPPSLLPYLPRFSTTDGLSVPFFLGGAAVSSTAPAEEDTEHHHHHHHQFQPSGLQLCYGDGARHSDQKGKSKN